MYYNDYNDYLLNRGYEYLKGLKIDIFMTDQNLTKIEFFFTNNLKVHIDCYSGRFYNGEIIEINQEKHFIILKDRVLGETPIVFEEIQNIEKMKGEENDLD